MSKSLSIIINLHSGQEIDARARDGAHAYTTYSREAARSHALNG
jgi:hypothetical protein